MNPFAYERAASVRDAIQAVAGDPDTRLLAGGTNLVDLMRAGVERPTRLVDINHLPGLDRIDDLPDGGLRIGALVSNSDLSADARIRSRYPVLAQATLSGASYQLRNRATTGGNLLQRTRCVYFYEPSTPCNKRQPGSGCSAIGGYNRYHAILGHSDHCIATHPSDMAVALAALDAIVVVAGSAGERRVPAAELHRLPGATPQVDTVLERGEIITAVELPPDEAHTRSRYDKHRDRSSYAFALVSVAAVLEMAGPVIRRARIALGGVAHRPWRATGAERLLASARPSAELFGRAADLAIEGARGYGGNDFKIALARRAVARTLADLTLRNGAAS